MMEFTRYDRKAVAAGWVHLGIGAFHRAHQAVYIDGVLADDPRWGIRGVSLRRADVRDALEPQDGLYTLAVNNADGMDCRMIGSVLDVLYAGEDDVLAALCDPTVRIVSLTVTEKGYCLDPATGGLNVLHPDIVADLRGETRSAIGWIVAGLARRKSLGAGPFTVVSCDNLPSNGRLVRRAVLQFAALVDGDLSDWIAQNVSFPSSMVDRIVPATTDADVVKVTKQSGWADVVPVMTEPFSQWVVEDDFCAGRPALETVGVQFVRDVAPFENMKLRMLNGSHSTLAYMACQMELPTVADAVTNANLAAVVRGVLAEVIPLLDVPETDLAGYGDQLMARFGNTALQHKTVQIAMDGSQKIPQRLLASIHDARASGRTHTCLIAGVAAWIAYVAHAPVVDPLEEQFARVRGFLPDVDAFCSRVLGMENVFGDLCDDTGFQREITEMVRQILTDGMPAFVASVQTEIRTS